MSETLLTPSAKAFNLALSKRRLPTIPVHVHQTLFLNAENWHANGGKGGQSPFRMPQNLASPPLCAPR